MSEKVVVFMGLGFRCSNGRWRGVVLGLLWCRGAGVECEGLLPERFFYTGVLRRWRHMAGEGGTWHAGTQPCEHVPGNREQWWAALIHQI